MWGITDPAIWQIELSANGVDGWMVVDFQPGESRAAAEGTTDVYYRIVGTDLLGNPITPYSNVVFASGS